MLIEVATVVFLDGIQWPPVATFTSEWPISFGLTFIRVVSSLLANLPVDPIDRSD